MKTYPALVLAGYSAEKPDSLAEIRGTERKVLLSVAGKRMIDWTLDALRQSQRVDSIVVVGVDPAEGVDLGPDIHYVPNQVDHFDNVITGIRAVQALQPRTEFLLVVSADIPLLKARTVDWFVEHCEKMSGDLFYSLVEQSVMVSQFPGAGRSYVHLKEGKFCGGDLFFLRASIINHGEELGRELLARRKSAFQQIRLAGLKTILKLIFHQLSIHDLEEVGSRLLQCEGRGVPSPYADLAMDVDKLRQLTLAQKYLAERMIT